MLVKERSVNVTGKSVVTVDGKEATVAVFNGSLNSDGSINVSKRISDKEKYVQNKTEVDKDSLEFENYVNGLIEEEE